MSGARRRFVVLVVVVAAGGASYAARETWLPAVGMWLDVGEPPRKAKYAFVAAGDEQTRPFAAAWLYKYGYVEKVLLSRPPRHAGSARVAEEHDELARAILEHEGVRPEDIEVLIGDVVSTMDEAQLLAPRIRADPQATFVVVSSDYHTRRLLWACRRAAPEAAERLHAFAAPTEGFHAGNYWRSERGATTYLSEYLRLAFYHVRYGYAGYAAAGLATAAVAVIVGRRYLRRDFFARRGGGSGRNSASNAT